MDTSLRLRACAGHEGIHERRCGFRELLLEQQRRQRVLEGETHAQLRAAPVSANWSQQPLPFQHSERTADEVHENTTIGLQHIARGELALQWTALYADGRDNFLRRAG